MSENVKDDNLFIIQRLRQLGAVPQRDPHKVAETRAAFLEQAHHLGKEKQKMPAVSAALPMRPTRSTKENNRPFWQRNPFRRKVVSPLWTLLATTIVTLALALGGTGIAAYAAQDSLPDQALYNMKTFTEDMQLQLTSQTENQLALALEFANRRVNELAAMAEQRKSAPEKVANRHGSEVDHALQLAAGLPSTGLAGALEQIRTHLQQQEQTMAKLLQDRPQDAVLQRMQTRLQQRLQLTESGLKDPQGFLERIRQQLQEQTQQQNQNQTQQENKTQQQNQNQIQQQNQNQSPTQPKQQNQTQQPSSGGSGFGQPLPTPMPNIPPTSGTGKNPGAGGGSGSGSGNGSGSGGGSGSGSGSGSGNSNGRDTGNGSGSGSGNGGH